MKIDILKSKEHLNSTFPIDSFSKITFLPMKSLSTKHPAALISLNVGLYDTYMISLSDGLYDIESIVEKGRS